MSSCLLCLENVKNSSDCIRVNSVIWEKQNMKLLIETHLWLMDTIKPFSSVCLDCCHELFTFHTFYKRILKAHTSISILVKTGYELMENIGSDHINDSCDDNDNDNVELDMPLEDSIFEKTDDTNSEGDEDQKIKESVLKNQSPNDQSDEFEDPVEKSKNKQSSVLNNQPPKDESEKFKDSLEKNKQTDDQINARVLERQTNKSLVNEKDIPPVEEDDGISNLSFTDDYVVREKNASQHAKSDNTSRRKTNAENRKKAAMEHDRVIAEHFQIECDICQIPLENFVALREHFKVEHKRRGYVRCCQRAFFTRSVLVDHIYGHINPDHFKCKDCNKVFSDRFSLTSHSKLHGDESKLLKCDVCGKTFSRMSVLRDHLLSHSSEKPFECSICGKL